MAASLYFYDLETSGVTPKNARIMQFGGQRTDMDLKPIGEPDEYFIKLTEDNLPEPDAILITGITPQRTREEGITEAEFLGHFTETIAVPETIFVGFNTIRFDDEFMRYLHYRNFYDPYEWQWQDKRARWDILDVVRMVRALRPDGINWPLDPDGKPTCRLELLTAANNLDHHDAHDALGDVRATIALARLIYNKQPKLFNYLLNMRDKKKVATLACSGDPFVYTSGKYSGKYEKTTVVASLGDHPGKQGILVFDLRQDPTKLDALTPEEMAKKWQEWDKDETKRFPVKTLQFNRCPAIAPLGVIGKEDAARLSLDMKAIKKHQTALAKLPDLRKKLLKALQILDKHRQAYFLTDELDVDNQLYDGFFSDTDKNAMGVVRAADSGSLATLELIFNDDRLNKLFPLYKARNYPQTLTDEERADWERFRYHRLMDGGGNSKVSRYFTRLGELAKRPNLTSNQKFLLEELQLYGESVIPEMYALEGDDS